MKRTVIGDVLWVSTISIITALLALPITHQIFIQWTSSHPYWMGFFKFALLATMGEILALRIAHRGWKRSVGMVWKIIVWGILGVLITFMFSFYSAGVSIIMASAATLLNNSFLSMLVQAFLTSLLMNLTFGIVFMAGHRLSDTYIEMRFKQKKPSLKELVHAVDWEGFLAFVVFKSIPLFWIPAHTLTFLLPASYRVVTAAYLSIILGLILVYANRTNKARAVNENSAD